MEKEFDFRIVFDDDLKSKVVTAKFHEGTFGRCVYNIYNKKGEFLFETKKEDVEDYIMNGTWVIEEKIYRIYESDGKFKILRKDINLDKWEIVGEFNERSYAEMLVNYLSK